MKRILIRSMQILIILVVLLVIGGVIYMKHARFGAAATGERLARMQSLPNYKDGAFHNLEPTAAMAEEATFFDALKTMFFDKDKRNIPTDSLPVVQTDLHSLPIDSNLFLWFGHSSYYIQLDGKRILVDPVFSKYATPVRVSIRAFKSTYNYSVEDIPAIDVLFITHDHWDHLDYNTFMKLQSKVKHIVTGLGVAAHLEKWGYPADQITELYWGETAKVDGFHVRSTTARHFSGRTFKRNTTLWSSFILEGSKKMFLGGDSGYGKHFKEIGDQYGPFDYAFLENGQYNKLWHHIHMMPEEVVLAAQDLQANYIIPVHSAKFPLANHAWDEPLIRVTNAANTAGVNILTSRIGEVVYLDHHVQNKPWWEGIQ